MPQTGQLGAARSPSAPQPLGRVPVVLCLDLSYSMRGAAAEELDRSVRRFVRHAAERTLIDICIVAFGDEAEVIVPMHAANGIEHIPALEVGGWRGYGTDLGAGLAASLHAIKGYLRAARQNAQATRAPLLVIVSDGTPTSRQHEHLAPTVARMEGDGELHTIALALGEDADDEALALIAAATPPISVNVRELGDALDRLGVAIRQRETGAAWRAPILLRAPAPEATDRDSA